MNYRNTFSKIVLLAILESSIFASSSYAQNTPDQLRQAYLTPPKNIVDQLQAPRYKNVFLVNLDPSRRYFVNYIQKENFTPIAHFANFFYNLGGLEIDPKANRNQTLTNEMAGSQNGGSGSGLVLTNALTGKKRHIKTPEGATISNATWSPDGTKLAYFANFENGTFLYVADTQNGRSKKLSKTPILATINISMDWSADGKYVYAVFVPKKRGPEPQNPAVQGPQVRMTTTEKNRLRTALYLLQNSHENKLLTYYTTGQLARINIATRKSQEIGKPAMIRNINVSPDGKYTMVTMMNSPFSYIVPVSRFGWTKEIWDLEGKKLVTLQKSEINTGIPNHKVLQFTNRKDFKWRPDGKGLSMIVESENSEKDKDDKAKKDKYKIVNWVAPFQKKEQKIIYSTSKKFNSVEYAEAPDKLFITEYNSGKQHLFFVDLNQPDKTHTIYQYSRNDFYKNPGRILHKTSTSGLSVVLLSPDKKNVYLSGIQYDKDPLTNAPRPFLDQMNIYTGKKKRIFQSTSDNFEKLATLLDDQANKLVVSRETSGSFPNFWFYNLKSGQKKQLTTNTDYNKDITNDIRKRFKVKRPDGFVFWITVNLPRNWNGKPLPALIWHYPREYDNQKDYDNSQRSYNKNEFPQIKSGWPERTEQLLTQDGYAVIQADWPIYSDRGGPNDAFVYSIQQNATAVIDSIVSKGYVDRDRIAIGGHSYGGFGTINALIHTSFFKAGIAGDANSNRLLTPLGFQREPRDLWRGRSRYIEMSPIIWANQLDGALLMYSGADDQNVGTSPFMSWQLFHALNALGKTAALYMYPYSQHHTDAKEIVLDRWTRWVEWLDHYVKNNKSAVPEIQLGKNNEK